MTVASKPRIEELQEILDNLEQYEPEPIDPNKITPDQRLYPRETLDMERIALFAEAMDNGDEFPPGLIASDRKTLIDGAHRTHAGRNRGKKQMLYRVLPVEDMVDIMALGAMTNGAYNLKPLSKNDMRSLFNRLFKELATKHGSVREGIKKFGGSIEGLARRFQIPSTGLTKIAAMVETLLERPAVDRKPKQPQQPPSRSPGRPKPAEDPWQEEDRSLLPEQAVKTALAAGTKVQEIPKQTPWDFLAQALLRTLRSWVDISNSATTLESLSDALDRLPDTDREFILHYRESLSVLQRLLGTIKED